jgi:DNA polymerase IV
MSSHLQLRWLLVDLNSFFASCEQQENPSLRGKPVAVVPMMAENTSVLAASYEAKAFGVKTGTKVFEARKMCPRIQFVSTGHKKYIEYHHRIIEAVHKICPVEKVLSIDEMACQLIGRECEYENALEIGRKIKKQILLDVGECLTSSVGIGPNIMIAKIASDLMKPNGLVVIPKDQISEKIGNCSVQVISGVGENMKYRLNSKGFYTINDLLRVGPQELKNIWGSIIGLRLAHEIRGEDIERANNQSNAYSHEHVLPPNLRNREGAYKILNKLLFKGCSRLRSESRRCKGLGIQIRFLEGTRFEKTVQFQEADDIFFMTEQFKKVFETSPDKKPVKVGIVLFNLTEVGSQQFSFFDDQKKNKLNQVIDLINDKHGANTLLSASYLDVTSQAKARISFQHIPDLKKNDF